MIGMKCKGIYQNNYEKYFSTSSATSQEDPRQNQNVTNQSTGQNTRRGAQNRDPTPNNSQANPVGAAKRKPKKPLPRLALNQIRHFQTTTENLIPKAPFCRCIKEALHFFGDYRITKEGIDALQVAAESYIVGIFNDAYCLTIHRKRVTIDPSDISLLLYIRGGSSQFH